MLVLVLAVYPSTPRPQQSARLQVVDSGADLAMEKAAAIQLAPAPAPAPALEPAIAPGTPPGPPPPGRLIIPSIGVNAPVKAVGLDRDGAMAVTNTSYDVGWYSPGVSPGNPGDAVLDGHLDWYDTSQAVFFNLKQVHPGDAIEVQRLDGVSKNFRVTRVTTVAYNASVPGLFANTGPARITLITCGGAWDKKLGQYLQRVIVDADLVT
ncbi:MAG: hypothetical protein NVSMB17_05780 [Candidatus Dormibacteria bacterium]